MDGPKAIPKPKQNANPITKKTQARTAVIQVDNGQKVVEIHARRIPSQGKYPARAKVTRVVEISRSVNPVRSNGIGERVGRNGGLRGAVSDRPPSGGERSGKDLIVRGKLGRKGFLRPLKTVEVSHVPWTPTPVNEPLGQQPQTTPIPIVRSRDYPEAIVHERKLVSSNSSLALNPNLPTSYLSYSMDPNFEKHPVRALGYDHDSDVGLNEDASMGGFDFPKEHIEGDIARGIEIMATDFVASLTIPANTAPGTVLYTLPVNPTTLANTRLATLASCFVRMLMEDAMLIFDTVLAATASGAIGIGFVADPDFELPGGTANIRVLAGSSEHNFRQVKIWGCGGVGFRNTEKQLRYIDRDVSDPRLTSIGTFYVIAVSNFPDEISAGNLYFHVLTKLSSPMLNTSAQNVGFGAWYQGDLTGATFLQPFGDDPTPPLEGNNLPILYTNQYSSDATRLWFVPANGSYLITFAIVGTGLTSFTIDYGSAIQEIFALTNSNSATSYSRTILIHVNTDDVTDRFINIHGTAVTTISSTHIWFMASPSWGVLFERPTLQGLWNEYRRLKGEVKDLECDVSSKRPERPLPLIRKVSHVHLG